MLHIVQNLDRAGLTPALHEFLRTGGDSLTNPYHNIQHALRVAAFAGQATNHNPTVMLAGLFHDWRHPGGFGDPDIDTANVERAATKVMSLPTDLLPAEANKAMAAHSIRGTRFPMDEAEVQALPRMAKLLRDADVWNMAFMTDDELLALQVGLAAEAGVEPHRQFENNVAFIKTLPALTLYAEAVALKHRDRLISVLQNW